MGENTTISWTHHTHNPWRGCDEDSPGCDNCYAKAMAKRNPKTLGVWGEEGTRVVASEKIWNDPIRWDREAKESGERRRVFCASVGDVFEDWGGRMLDAQGRALWVQDSERDVFYWEADKGEPGFAYRRKPVTIHDVRERLMFLIRDTPNLDWLLLTKRPQNFRAAMVHVYDLGLKRAQVARNHMVANWLDGKPPENVWFGTSVEDQAAADRRIPDLLKIPAAVRFLSCEPLLGPVDLWPHVNHPHKSRWPGREYVPTGPFLDWIIVGGESGPKARPMHPDWARSLRDQCTAAGVAFHFKQWGEWAPYLHVRDELQLPVPGMNKWATCYSDGTWRRRELDTRAEPMLAVGAKQSGRLLDGREWNEFPKEKA